MLIDVIPLIRRSWANLEASQRLLEASQRAPDIIFAITTKSCEAVEKSRRLLASLR